MASPRAPRNDAATAAQVIYDFQVDVWRVAVSIYNHALTNGLTEAKAESAVETFCEAYVEVVKGYVGNEDAELFEGLSANVHLAPTMCHPSCGKHWLTTQTQFPSCAI